MNHFLMSVEKRLQRSPTYAELEVISTSLFAYAKDLEEALAKDQKTFYTLLSLPTKFEIT